MVPGFGSRLIVSSFVTFHLDNLGPHVACYHCPSMPRMRLDIVWVPLVGFALDVWSFSRPVLFDWWENIILKSHRSTRFSNLTNVETWRHSTVLVWRHAGVVGKPIVGHFGCFMPHYSSVVSTKMAWSMW